MKTLRAMQYAVPRSLDEAIRPLSTAQGAAYVLAGGTDLVVQSDGLRKPDVVIDIKRIPELNRITGGVDASKSARPSAAPRSMSIWI
jgi:CO/xanthine dehydrogenase FAD-binding subunit